MSAGLETLVDENRIASSEEVETLLYGQLSNRWGDFDRPVLVATYRVAEDLIRVAEIDAQVEAQTLADDSRAGSRRSGRSLLGVHAKLGTDFASEYQSMVNRSMANGHNCVVQGLVWRGAGIAESVAEAMAAHTFCIGLVGAALRLGVVGHIDAQRIIKGASSIIEKILSSAPAGMECIGAFTPEQEIAVMRHETMSYRLFVN